jgi:NADPH-dependent curcumin reductase CurA
VRGREIQLVARPEGAPDEGHFALVDVDVRAPAAREVLVRNVYLSVDPYMRGRMSDRKSYLPPFALHAPLEGAAIGVVESSDDAALPAGATVYHMLGWREYAVGPAKAFRTVDLAQAPASAYLGVLGIPGFTAWIGLFTIGGCTAGDTVFISSAAGAVGSMAVQLAKRAGARVIGSTRSSESAGWLRRRFGIDLALVPEPGRFTEQLRDAAPGGIDVAFDNVGGDQLEAAIANAADFARFVLCGMIAAYNVPPPGPRNIALAVSKRLLLQGFIASDHAARLAEFFREIGPAVARNEIVPCETFVDGLTRAPAALCSLFSPGTHVGKLIVRL